LQRCILAIDQGTTGTRSYLFDSQARVLGSAYSEFTQHFPKPGWVEHDAEEIWETVERTGRAALKSAGLKASAVAAVGITNQRETTLLWDRKNSKPIHRAIVWQCRRTAGRCDELKGQGHEKAFRDKTGLVLDAYFSGTKIEWLLKHLPGAARRAARGELAFGTIDTWLLWKLSGGRAHATDFSNASRTLLYDIRKKAWDPKLQRLLHVPSSLLPKVQASSSIFGLTGPRSFLGSGIPIAGMAGDQQAALFGQGCFEAGSLKNTYGTGCFLLLNLGKRHRLSKNKLLTTLICDAQGQPAYGLEGAVFIGGAAVQWVRDGLKLIKSSADSEKLSASIKDTGGVYLVPAFVGLGAPHWDQHARGALIGLTRGSGIAQVTRAAVESMAYQSADLVTAMQKDAGLKVKELRVDGGASKNALLMQFQADLLGARINRPKMVETTALGAAFLAGLRVGLWKNAAQLQKLRKVDKVFKPRMKPAERKQLLSGWNDAVSRVLTN
jgi:glycerol kinase